MSMTWLLLAVLAVGLAEPTPKPSVEPAVEAIQTTTESDLAEEGQDQVAILKQINRVNEDGSYTFGYEAADGSFKIETRDVAGNVKGMFGFVDEAGELKRVSYSASNGTGFQSTGSPNIPPIVTPGTDVDSTTRINLLPGGTSTERPALPVYIYKSTTRAPRPEVIQHIPKLRPTPGSITTQPTESEEVTNIHRPTYVELIPKKSSTPNYITIETTTAAPQEDDDNPRNRVVQIIRPRGYKKVLVTKRPVEVSTTPAPTLSTTYPITYLQRLSEEEASENSVREVESNSVADSGLAASGTEDSPDVYGGGPAGRPFPGYRTVFPQVPQYQRILQTSYLQNQNQFAAAAGGRPPPGQPYPNPNQVGGGPYPPGQYPSGPGGAPYPGAQGIPYPQNPISPGGYSPFAQGQQLPYQFGGQGQNIAYPPGAQGQNIPYPPGAQGQNIPYPPGAQGQNIPYPPGGQGQPIPYPPGAQGQPIPYPQNPQIPPGAQGGVPFPQDPSGQGRLPLPPGAGPYPQDPAAGRLPYPQDPSLVGRAPFPQDPSLAGRAPFPQDPRSEVPTPERRPGQRLPPSSYNPEQGVVPTEPPPLKRPDAGSRRPLPPPPIPQQPPYHQPYPVPPYAPDQGNPMYLMEQLIRMLLAVQQARTQQLSPFQQALLATLGANNVPQELLGRNYDPRYQYPNPNYPPYQQGGYPQQGYDPRYNYPYQGYPDPYSQGYPYQGRQPYNPYYPPNPYQGYSPNPAYQGGPEEALLRMFLGPRYPPPQTPIPQIQNSPSNFDRQGQLSPRQPLPPPPEADPARVFGQRIPIGGNIVERSPVFSRSRSTSTTPRSTTGIVKGSRNVQILEEPAASETSSTTSKPQS